MRRWMALVLVIGTGGGFALGAGPDPAAQRLRQSFPGVEYYVQGDLTTRVYGAIFGLGPSPELTADAFVREYAGVFGLTAEELQPGNPFNGDYTLPLMYEPGRAGGDGSDYKFTLVYYHQVRDGIPVYQAELRLLVRNEPGYPLVLAVSSLKELGDFVVPTAALRSPAQTAAFEAALQDAPSLTNFGPTELVIYAGPADEPAKPTLALTFEADNYAANNGRPEKYRFVADAQTGAILHKENLIIFTDIVGNVSGMATTGPKSDACGPEEATPMPYATVTMGSTTVYADASGNFVIPNSGTSQVTVQSPMSGRYFTVDNVAGSEETLSLNVTPPGPANFMHNQANTTEAIRAQVNGYVQANVVRNWVLTYHPTYPTISTQLNFPVRVMRSDLYCPGNAWYDGSSINFCAASGSYPNTAYSSVILHEYGHHIVQSGGSGQDQYGEGVGDCVSVIILDDPVLGYGFTGNCNTGLRTAVNTMQYPCSGEAHACAPLLSGCIWDTRNALVATDPHTYRSILGNLMVNSVPLHTGTLITPQITIDWLTLDDNDGDLANGTPHYNQICAGFNAHNMNCPALSLLSFSFPNGRPELVSPAGGTTVRVVVSPLAGQPQPNTGWFYYRIGSENWTSAPMTQVSPNVYDATFPAAPCGTIIRYYFSAQATSGPLVYSPSNAPATSYSATAATSMTVLVDDAFETDSGWTRGDVGDNATSGLWDRDIPEATAAQPGSDHTPDPGVRCWVTDHRAGSSVGSYDVDGGKTTLKSPWFNLSGYTAAKISYWRWYSNNQGANPNADTFRVDITNNNEASWINVETVGPSGAETGGGWYYHEFSVTDFVSLNNPIRLRFIAEDAGGGSIVEAALDDFQIVVYTCVTQYTLTTTVSGQGTVTLDPPGGVYNAGTSVQLAANAAPGWHFDHWEGALSGSANPATLLMDGNKSVTAVFVLNQYTLTTGVVGQGTVTLNPPGGVYTHGTTVQLTAEAATGWHFDHWEGALSGTDNPATLFMDGDKSVTAFFAQNPAGCPGDLNCDGEITYADIDLFVTALSGQANWPYPECPWINADLNNDGDVTYADIDPFVAAIGTSCP
jgi:hypothetical protein